MAPGATAAVDHAAVRGRQGGGACWTATSARCKLPNFDKAVDFGWFYFLTKPIFYALDWLFQLTGNFGVAILLFTVFVKLLFFPLANKSYKSMSRMKMLNPEDAGDPDAN